MAEDQKSSGLLSFIPGEEYKLKIENLDELRSSLFWEVYYRAAKNVKDILENYKFAEEKNSSFLRGNPSYNNIIAFTGDRGTGKSSSMISFAEGLKGFYSSGSKAIFNKDNGLDIDGELKKYSFHDVGIIDPSLFEMDDNILEIVIAKMFSKFNTEIKKQKTDPDYNRKRKLLKSFQDVLERLKITHQRKEHRFNNEVLECLSNMASGSNLRESLIKLIKEYLDFMGDKDGSSGERRKNIFLLVIDDFDLNIKNAMEMAEQIRKYLVIPDVVILMAAKLDQLADMFEQYNRKKFAVLLREERMSHFEPQLMAKKYLEKLVPEDRRLYLPDIKKIENKDINIKIYKSTEEKEEDDKKKDGEKKEGIPLEETLLKKIYEKTGLIFLKQNYEIHPLVPNNLRDLHSLILMLNRMHDIEDKTTEDKKEQKKKNIRRFEDFFFNTWVKNNLSLDEQVLVENFMSIDIEQKNKFIITTLGKKYSAEKTKKFTLDDDDRDKKAFDLITAKDNIPTNISLGDVLFFLNKIALYNDSSETRKFIFTIKTIYSLIIYKLLFCEKKDYNIQKILGGSVYNPESTKLIPRAKGEDTRRDHFEFDYGKCVANLYDEKSPLNFKLLEWAHYFLLHIGRKDEKFRAEEGRYYDNYPNLGKGAIEVKYAVFDVLAFVFFLFNPERILARILPEESEDENIKTALKKYFENETEQLSLNETLYKKLEHWRKKHGTVLPIYSIEFLEKILSLDSKGFPSTGTSYAYYFRHLLLLIEKAIKNILIKNDFLRQIKDKKVSNDESFVEAFRSCPIINTFFEDNPAEELATKRVKLLEAIFNSAKLSTKLRIPETIEFINENIVNFGKRYDTTTSIKSRLKKFTNSADDLGFPKLVELITKAQCKREEMDNEDIKDNLKKIKALEGDVVEMLKEKQKELESYG